MKKINNILFSTTKSWNCGDDFILFGTINLLKSALKKQFNPFIYNRSPSLHRIRINRKINIQLEYRNIPIDISPVNEQVWNYDNSWHPDLGFDLFDCIIFAGTPEWLGPIVSPLSKAILSSEVKILHLGLGSHEGIKNLTFEKLLSEDKEVLKRSSFISVRNKGAADILSPLKTKQLPCPALFSSPSESIRKRKRKVALSSQAMSGGQRISNENKEYCVKLFTEINKHYECSIVCHYINDVYEWQELGIDIIYSHNANDYLEIYNQFDLTVTTRVHGAGLCASLGIPGFVIQHSERSDTTDGFGSERIQLGEDIDSVLDRLSALDIEESSSRIIEHKRKYHEVYCKDISSVLEI